ncbi:MAG: hypothetical protein CML17_10890 [Pusillimonas sp.]|nr:hypothetical protein [Pusillimonas sp.]|tara:strand:- start:293 stop:1120 length:828 start_codon:yes stop_codon:yes gene_type:complete
MRNNQDRMLAGAATDNLQQADPPPQNQTLEFIVPTELVELPSKGLFYGEGHPLHGQDSIEIKHMTTKEEDILTNESYIRDGSAVDRLLKSIIVNKRINVKDLLIGDKNAITLAARTYGYGAEYETKFTCPSCGTIQQTSFDLTEIENGAFEKEAEEFGGEIDYEANSISLVVPRTKTKLEFRLLNDDEQKQKKKNKNKLISQFFSKIIKSVNGNSDQRYIKSYIDSMSALDSRYIRAAYQKMIPNVDMGCEFECENCGYSGKVEVPLKAEFFWPK